MRTDGVCPDDTVLICVSRPREALLLFYGAMLAGALPLMIAPPATLQTRASWLNRLEVALATVGSRKSTLYLDPATELEQFELSGVHVARHTATPPSCYDCHDTSTCLPVTDAVAFLQLSSGTTGSGELIAVTHGNVLNNTFGLRAAGGTGNHEVGISWLPLYHDMGLVGAELFCLSHGYPLVLFSPADFLRNPMRWMRAIEKFRCTLTVMPNFALDYCTKAHSQDSQPLDIGSLKKLFCGAEPIRANSLRMFSNQFSSAGFTADRFLPCYGLAENTLAVTVRRPSDQLRVATVAASDIVIGSALNILKRQHLTPGDENDDGTELIELGPPIAGTSLFVVDASGNPISGEGVVGQIAVQGNCVATRLAEDSASAQRAQGTTLLTGDLGFMLEEKLYVIDRLKNIVIHNGKNYSATELEKRAADVIGVSADQVAVFEEGITGTQGSLVLLVDGVRGGDPNRLSERLPALAALQPPITRLAVGRRRVIPRTSSGKKQYYECRNKLARNQFDLVLDLHVNRQANK